jgi:hypothetical protein
MLSASGGLDQLVSFRVDFNAVDDSNRLRALGRYASSPAWKQAEVGQPVRVFDADGNQGVAIVESVPKRDLFYLRVNWSTWQAAPSRMRVTSMTPPQLTQEPLVTEASGRK